MGRYANSPVMHGFVDCAIRSGERAATDVVDAPPPAVTARIDQSPVATAQIAPTILVRRHLDPRKLQAVVAENIATLPGL